MGLPGLWDLLSTSGSNYNLTLIENQYFRWVDISIDTNLGNIDVYDSTTSGYTWELDGMGGGLGNPTNILTLHSNVTMNLVHGTEGYPAADDSGYAKVIHVLPTATFLTISPEAPGIIGTAPRLSWRTVPHFYYFNSTGGNNTGTAIQWNCDS